MFKKTIEFETFDGEPIKKDFYFNFTKTEINDMFIDGLESVIQEWVDANKRREIYYWIKDIILKAYGEKSEDGIAFMKSEEISKKFEATLAYDKMVTEIMEDESAQIFFNFFAMCLPKDMQTEFKKSVTDAMQEANK